MTAVLAADVVFLALCFVLFRIEPVLLLLIVVVVVVFSAVQIRRIFSEARAASSTGTEADSADG